ncbi:hypothetical protein KKH27_13935 [bacterium]|nr:hypothetical protein [bacterium]MBU1983978.1 hypothetical protein [bacterium]
MARWAAFIARHQNPDAAWLTVDAGNYVDRAAAGGCSDKCQFLVTSYADLHYDVLNLGKQEVWMGYETLVTLRDTTPNTDFISANLVDAKTHKPVVKPYVIKDYGSLRVGVIGLLNEADFPPGTALLDTNTLRILPAVEAAKKYIPALARKVDAVILLADLPTNILDTLLAAVPDVDFVISSGALRTGEQPAKIGQTQVIGTGSSGYNGHYAMLEFNPAWDDSIGFSNYQDQLGDTYDEKGLWADRLAAFEAKPSTPQPITPQKSLEKSKAPPPGTSVTPIKPAPGKVSTTINDQG